MKKLFAATALAMLALGVSVPAAGAGKQAKPKQVQTEKETGPVGFGPIRMGMSKSDVDALTSGDVYLASPLSPDNRKYSDQPDGLDRFESKLKTPLSAALVKAVFTFKDDALIFMYLSASDQNSVISDLSEQVRAKYGDGTFSDSTQDEPCIYRNGASFSVKKGDQKRTWSQKSGRDGEIRTSFVRSRMDMCPVNLRWDTITNITLEMLSIEAIQASKPAAPAAKNLF